MPVYLVTGKLGSGKSLCCVGRITDYLRQNRMVATNLNLYLDNLDPWAKRTRCIRLPDKPTLEDLENLPEPYEGEYDEDKSGLIVLDECGTWLNTRNYRDKSRMDIIDKLLHIRKAGWDVMFIIQHINMIDSQIREGLGELIVYCSRTDRLKIPFLTPLMSYLGLPLRPPKIHLAIVKYGSQHNAPVNDRWVYMGSELHDCYDTRQVFGANKAAMHSLLPPYNIIGYHLKRKDYATFKARKSLIDTLNLCAKAKRLFFLVGLAAGVGVHTMLSEPEESTENLSTEMAQIIEEPETSVFDLLYITASIESSTGFEYHFSDQLTLWEPEQHGYQTRWITHCKALLVGLNEHHTITCEPKINLLASHTKTAS